MNGSGNDRRIADVERAVDEAELLDQDVDPSARRRGGLGVFLMNQLMDEVRYRGGADGNILTMSKRLANIATRQSQGLNRDKLFAVAVAFASALSLVSVM